MSARQQSVPPWFGRRLRAERERRGWSVRQLAAYAGLAIMTVTRAEGGRDVALSSVAAMARTLKVSLDALVAEPACVSTGAADPARCGAGTDETSHE